MSSTVALEYFEGDRITPTTVSYVQREELGWILLVILLKYGYIIEKMDEDRLRLRDPDVQPGLGDEYHALVG